MIGRGTRTCKGLIDGEDKDKFYIFDFGRNFEFFRENPNGHEVKNVLPVQGAIFKLQFEMVYKLQDMEFQNERLIKYRDELISQMSAKVGELEKDNFAVHQHLKYVELYSDKNSYNNISQYDINMVKEELAPLIKPDKDDINAVRFDALMYGIELASIIGNKHTKARSDLLKRVDCLSHKMSIDEIRNHKDMIEKILKTDYLDRAGIDDFEHIRSELRNLMKYTISDIKKYEIDCNEEILSMEFHEAELENDDLNNYKAKAEYYIRQHQDNVVIAKLKTNRPLSSTDIKILEDIMWKDLGSKKDYEEQVGEKPLGEFVREIVGLDMNAAKEAFSEYLDEKSYNSRQIYFVNQIIEYIVRNGIMKDFSVLREAPFNNYGSFVELYNDNLNAWNGIKNIINSINSNAAA